MSTCIHEIVEQKEKNFIDIFENIPLDILSEKILNCYGMISIAEGNFFETCRIYVELLSTKTYFDPQLQNFAIKMLKSVFNHLSLPIDCIINFQKTLLQKDLDIIILIDYNQTMTQEQIILSHSLAKIVLDNLLDDDSIALYAYNEILYEAFPLQKKGIYKVLLEEVIKQLLIYPGGKTKLFDVLLITAGYLFDLKQSKFQKKLNQFVQFNQLKASQKKDDKLEIEEVKKLSKVAKSMSFTKRNSQQKRLLLKQVLQINPQLPTRSESRI